MRLFSSPSDNTHLSLASFPQVQTLANRVRDILVSAYRLLCHSVSTAQSLSAISCNYSVGLFILSGLSPKLHFRILYAHPYPIVVWYNLCSFNESHATLKLCCLLSEGERQLRSCGLTLALVKSSSFLFLICILYQAINHLSRKILNYFSRLVRAKLDKLALVSQTSW